MANTVTQLQAQIDKLQTELNNLKRDQQNNGWKRGDVVKCVVVPVHERKYMTLGKLYEVLVGAGSGDVWTKVIDDEGDRNDQLSTCFVKATEQEAREFKERGKWVKGAWVKQNKGDWNGQSMFQLECPPVSREWGGGLIQLVGRAYSYAKSDFHLATKQEIEEERPLKFGMWVKTKQHSTIGKVVSNAPDRDWEWIVLEQETDSGLDQVDYYKREELIALDRKPKTTKAKN